MPLLPDGRSKDSFDKTKRRQQLVFLAGKRLLDNELNEIQQIVNRKLLNLSQRSAGTGPVGDAFDVFSKLGVADTIFIRPGLFFDRGEEVEIFSELTVTTPAKPLTGNRTDSVYVQWFDEEIDSAIDPDLIGDFLTTTNSTTSGVPTVKTIRRVVNVLVNEGAAEPPPGTGINQFRIRLLNRTSGETEPGIGTDLRKQSQQVVLIRGGSVEFRSANPLEIFNTETEVFYPAEFGGVVVPDSDNGGITKILTDDAINYVFIDHTAPGTASLNVSVTLPTDPLDILLRKITVTSGAVTEDIDLRVFTGGLSLIDLLDVSQGEADAINDPLGNRAGPADGTNPFITALDIPALSTPAFDGLTDISVAQSQSFRDTGGIRTAAGAPAFDSTAPVMNGTQGQMEAIYKTPAGTGPGLPRTIAPSSANPFCVAGDESPGMIPLNACILWDITSTCPNGFTDVTASQGRYILIQSTTGTPLAAPVAQNFTANASILTDTPGNIAKFQTNIPGSGVGWTDSTTGGGGNTGGGLTTVTSQNNKVTNATAGYVMKLCRRTV